jgi:3-oxoacyl-[acyl-carrier protein] reductase
MPTASMKRTLSGQTSIITGASRSRGIGAAICHALAAGGSNIFFTSWQKYDAAMPWREEPEFPEKLAAELRQKKVEVAWIETDLGEPEIATRIVDEVERRFGPAHIVVNNACHWVADSLESLNADMLNRSFAVNARAPILLSLEFVRRFAGKGARRIISLTSGQLRGPMPGELAYAVTKASIDAFTISFASEAGRFGITVNAVDPGPTDTGWMDDELKHSLAKRSALGRTGRAGDVARFVQFLASSEADWITGQILRSDGGFW